MFLVISQYDSPCDGIGAPIIEGMFETRTEAIEYVVLQHLENISYDPQELETLQPWLRLHIEQLPESHYFETYGQYHADDEEESFTEQLRANSMEGTRFHRVWIQEYATLKLKK